MQQSRLLEDSDLEEVVLDRRPLLYLVLAGLLCLLLVFWRRIFLVIPAGEGGVLFQPLFGGVALNRVYGEGLTLLWPWDTMTVYKLRVQEKTIEFPVLNGDGLELHVKLSVRYHPRADALGFLHQRVGPDYESKLIAPTCEYCVRDIMGSSSINDLYFNRDDVMTKLQRELTVFLGQRYVDLDGVFIRGIGLPEAINKAIQQKEEQRQLYEAYDFRIRKEKREVVRKTIEAFGIHTYNNIISEGLDERLLKWQGIGATERLGSSPNTKVVIVGNGPNGLPLILGNEPASTGKKVASDSVTRDGQIFDKMLGRIQKDLKNLLDSVGSAMDQAGSDDQTQEQAP